MYPLGSLHGQHIPYAPQGHPIGPTRLLPRLYSWPTSMVPTPVPNQVSRTGAEEFNTPTEIAAFLKSVYQPVTKPGKRPAELLWVTTTLTDHPVDDTLPRYKAGETEASLFVSIDVLDNHTGVRHAALEGHTAVAARGLVVMVACALHHVAHTIEG